MLLAGKTSYTWLSYVAHWLGTQTWTAFCSQGVGLSTEHSSLTCSTINKNLISVRGNPVDWWGQRRPAMILNGPCTSPSMNKWGVTVCFHSQAYLGQRPTQHAFSSLSQASQGNEAQKDLNEVLEKNLLLIFHLSHRTYYMEHDKTESTGPLVQKLSRISRERQQSMKRKTGALYSCTDHTDRRNQVSWDYGQTWR